MTEEELRRTYQGTRKIMLSALRLLPTTPLDEVRDLILDGAVGWYRASCELVSRGLACDPLAPDDINARTFREQRCRRPDGREDADVESSFRHWGLILQSCLQVMTGAAPAPSRVAEVHGRFLESIVRWYDDGMELARRRYRRCSQPSTDGHTDYAVERIGPARTDRLAQHVAFAA